MGIFSKIILRPYVVAAIVLLCSIFAVSLFHPLYTHHHPGDIAHDVTSEHKNESAPEPYSPFATHGHEEEVFVGLTVVLFVVAFLNIDKLLTNTIQTAFVFEKNDRPRRKPPIITLLFTCGILNPRLS